MMGTSNDNSTSPSLTFLKLPLEVRQTIYQFCLIVNSPINPCPTIHEPPSLLASKTHRPCVALLRVNKQVEAEAADVLYGHNRWLIPLSLNHYIFYPQKVSVNNARRFRHIIVRLDFYKISDELRYSIILDSHKYEHAQTSKQRFNYIHSRMLRILNWEVHKVRRYVKWEYKKLQTLVLDVENLYCPLGCCRLELMRGRLYHQFISQLNKLPSFWPDCTLHVTVTGLSTQEEKDIVRNLWKMEIKEEDTNDSNEESKSA